MASNAQANNNGPPASLAFQRASTHQIQTALTGLQRQINEISVQGVTMADTMNRVTSNLRDLIRDEVENEKRRANRVIKTVDTRCNVNQLANWQLERRLRRLEEKIKELEKGGEGGCSLSCKALVMGVIGGVIVVGLERLVRKVLRG